MSEYSLLGLQKSNRKITRFAWFIFISCIILGFTILAMSISSIERVKERSNMVNELIGFGNKVNETANKVNRVLLNEDGLSPVKGEQLKKELHEIDTQMERIILLQEGVSVDEIAKDSILNLTKDLKRYYYNFKGIALLVIIGNNGVDENTDIFKSQLFGYQTSIENTLGRLRIFGVNELQNSTQFVLWFNVATGFVIICLLIIGYFGILKPLKQSFIKSESLVEVRNIEVVDTTNKINSIVIEQNEIALQLKTKNAQVVKLQESLEESIKQINNLGKDKSLIYLNAATDLEGFLKVINLQKEIVENQTNVSKNDSWRPLTSAVSQLNSMVGDYFKKSRGVINHQIYTEVYLSQLISEIILSTSTVGVSVFEQMPDMPAFKTNVDLLKNVLQPYFDLVASVETLGKVSVSAIESGNFCEIKFVGLSKNFVREILKIEKLKMVEMSFIDFKIYMAKNTIMERGGKVWIQDDVVKKGVLSLRWAL